MASKTPLPLMRLLVSFRNRISLRQDKEDEQKTIELYRSESVFRGTNVWILIIAIFVASLGLNVNSTAVIIGAMLISPLMGPIMGAGLALGIYDFKNFKIAIKNLLIATLVGILTSTIYFILTPYSEAQSELLARTSPTIYDVFIAFFGGMAGIIAGASSKKGNVIPGVAIATALMPPLCTVGYGIATLQTHFIFGALYLYLINSVFIGLATLLIVRYLKYPVIQYVNKVRKKKIKQLTTSIIIIMLIPSIYFAYILVLDTVYEKRINTFIDEQFNFKNSTIIKTNILNENDSNKIELVLIGKPLSKVAINELNNKMIDYGLNKYYLSILQDDGGNLEHSFDAMEKNLQKTILNDLYNRNEQVIKDKDAKIALLESQLMEHKAFITSDNFIHEIHMLYPEIKEFSISKSALFKYQQNDASIDSTYIAFINFYNPASPEKITKIKNWLQIRLEIKEIEVRLIRENDIQE